MSPDIVTLNADEILPDDGCAGTLVGRAWLPADAAAGRSRAVAGPAVSIRLPSVELLGFDELVATIKPPLLKHVTNVALGEVHGASVRPASRAHHAHELVVGKSHRPQASARINELVHACGDRRRVSACL